MRAQEGSAAEINEPPRPITSSEPLRCRPDHPVEFPLLMAAWKLAPALAAGNCTSRRPSRPRCRSWYSSKSS
ncbi:aldehyde dehydrogenase family protein [Stutzerimonas xanthomarina]|uniref:aldehyde dehydrogenase family protein n=1 Tax=Stutzerimonas xanthomarina TaxID=271420 RepID=UPI003AA89DBD